MQIPLSDPVDISGFHAEATRLLAQQVPPQEVEWRTPAPAEVAPQEVEPPGRTTVRHRAARAIIPQSFVRMSELVVLHRHPERFQLLYRTLWRLVYEPGLKENSDDIDLVRIRQMAHAVRRDIARMKARLAFRPMPIKGQEVAVAWYEPTHHVCEVVAGWLARKRAAPWILLTPDRCVRWDGQQLWSAPPLPAHLTPAPTAPESAWVRTLSALDWV